ncbi:unnamed protein product [Ranitomeya imitator]|uniref:Transposase n=1 Tax=Ranitomeya imitator TaxID=111125 RepID=A0ABN9MR24_9NEOB|nr:unnamed protein product [Ranitomeya imitator]
MPYRLAESEAFKALMAYAVPRYDLPSQHFFARKTIPALHQHVKDRIVYALRQSVERSESSSTERSRTTTPSTAASVAHEVSHYGTASGKRQQAVLEMKCLGNNRHTAEVLAEYLQQETHSWLGSVHLDAGKVVSDNGRNFMAAIAISELKHIPCLAHTLNLVVQCFLKNYPELPALLLKCFEECTWLVSADDAIISIPLMRLLMQSLTHIKEQASAAEEEGSLDDSQPLSAQGTLLDEVADEEEDDDDEYLWEDASQGAIETGGVARLYHSDQNVPGMNLPADSVGALHMCLPFWKMAAPMEKTDGHPEGHRDLLTLSPDLQERDPAMTPHRRHSCFLPCYRLVNKGGPASSGDIMISRNHSSPSRNQLQARRYRADRRTLWMSWRDFEDFVQDLECFGSFSIVTDQVLWLFPILCPSEQ